MGPLAGYKIIELLGLGPGPFCGMLLADLGAEVITIERQSKDEAPIHSHMRNRRSIALNLKDPDAVEVLLKLCEGADAFFEGFRPGVAEKLGVGPEQCMARNPRLVYGRMTGWGQTGPMAHTAGHDINYIALSGVLNAMGSQGQKPTPPLNLMGDFGGGGLFLAFGLVCALLEAQKSGKGQVVDAAMVDGAAALMGYFHAHQARGVFDGDRGTHFLSGAAHFYDTYETSDGLYLAIGSIEPQFYQELIRLTGIDGQTFAEEGFYSKPVSDRWPELSVLLAEKIKTKTRDEWCTIFDGTDACVSPVLSLQEVQEHPHHQARNSYFEMDGYWQQSPGPRFDRTPATQPRPVRKPGEDSASVLSDLGLTEEQIEQLRVQGAIT